MRHGDGDLECSSFPKLNVDYTLSCVSESHQLVDEGICKLSTLNANCRVAAALDGGRIATGGLLSEARAMKRAQNRERRRVWTRVDKHG